MKKLLIILLLLPLFMGVKPESEYRSDLTAVLELRQDLQHYFPDGKNGVDKMEGWTIEQWAGEFGWQEYKSLKKYNAEAEKDYIYEKYLPIERALAEISLREYVRNGEDKYNCVDFSNDLQEKLEEQNISSVLLTGSSPNGCHRWLAIEFEPITGNILEPNKYEPNSMNKNFK